MKNKKVKIIVTALVCAAIISIGSFAMIASANEEAQSNENSLGQKLQSAFKYVAEKADGLFRGGKHHGFMLFEPGEAAEILGMTEDELKAKLDEAGGNVAKVLEDAGKLEEYKAKVLENYKANLDKQVTAGKITQEQADEKYAEAETTVNGINSENSPVINFKFGGENGGKMEFKFDGELPEGFELPEGAETREFKIDGKHGGFGFGMGIGGIKGHFGSDSVNIAEILGITEDELKAKLEEADGNIFKVLEDSGKLEEYKAQLLQSFKAKLDGQVASGAITQEKADEAYAMLEETVSNFSGENGGLRMPGFCKPFRGFERSEEFRGFEKSDKAQETEQTSVKSM